MLKYLSCFRSGNRIGAVVDLTNALLIHVNAEIISFVSVSVAISHFNVFSLWFLLYIKSDSYYCLSIKMSVLPFRHSHEKDPDIVLCQQDGSGGGHVLQ